MKKTLLPLLIALLLTTLACSLFSSTGLDLEQEPVAIEQEPVATEQPPAATNNNILFQDDFSNTNSGWDRADWDTGLTDYGNGVYRTVVKIPS